jgi:exonuclease I
MTEQPWLDLFRLERRAKQGIVKQIDLADAKILSSISGERGPLGCGALSSHLPLAATAVDRLTSKMNPDELPN